AHWYLHSFPTRRSSDLEEMKGVFKIHNEYGEEWTDAVSHQFGNYDYLMGADIEYRNPYVVEEMKNWIRWYMETTKVDGIRLDALDRKSTRLNSSHVKIS